MFKWQYWYPEGSPNNDEHLNIIKTNDKLLFHGIEHANILYNDLCSCVIFDNLFYILPKFT